jgi:hypothetical protein
MEDGRLGRKLPQQFSSRHGDRLNAILCGIGQNVGRNPFLTED